jgi:hypothetical protein
LAKYAKKFKRNLCLKQKAALVGGPIKLCFF